MREKRLHAMESYIFEQRHTTLMQLCRHFNISINTVRRDVEMLLSWGAVKKVYGGVVVNPQYRSYLHHGERSAKNTDEKIRIGRKAAEFLKSNDIILIDSGSTTSEFIRVIDTSLPLTVITNSMSAIDIFSQSPAVKLISLGGEYLSYANGFASMETLYALKRYKADKVFLSISGLELSPDGITNPSAFDSEVKKAMISCAREVYLLVDSSKFGVITPIVIAAYDQIDYLITDAEPSLAYIRLLKEHNVELVIA